MAKSIVEYTARRIIYDTPLPFAEVATRLEAQLNKPSGGKELFHVLGSAKTKDELESGIKALADGHDFIFFAEFVHHRWLSTYTESTNTPKAVVYVFGNPLIAQAMLQRDLAAGLNIPPKLMLLEKTDGGGTKIVYDDPASLIAVPAYGQVVDDTLKRAAEDLSVKVEALVKTVITENAA
ncbi:TT1751-like protein [Cubamyces sp. BRFM 1775]|nr:TT1751-like protein [Cubamyces sp. BRFM 1775]